MSQLAIGQFGFGVVGEGIYQVLQNKPDFNAEIKKVVIKNPHKNRATREDLFSTDAADILEDASINLVVELISDADAAFNIVMAAFEKGKSVISANKKMIADHHETLIAASRKHNVSFLYEGAVCGSVPIIRNLEEYFDNDLLESICGIVNGSTNFILSKMYTTGTSYSSALTEAQQSGFAEADASLDVDGHDASFKLSIMALHGFGQTIDSSKILRKGIAALLPQDFQYAKEKKQVIKLVAECHTATDGSIESITVLPCFLDEASALGKTDNEYNGVLVKSSLADVQFLYGKGAGRFPTSSAVLSDISAFKYGYRYAYKKGVRSTTVNNDKRANFYISRKPEIALDSDLFETIQSEYKDTKICVTIGEISFEKLNKSGLLNNPEVSIIKVTANSN